MATAVSARLLPSMKLSVGWLVELKAAEAASGSCAIAGARLKESILRSVALTRRS